MGLAAPLSAQDEGGDPKQIIVTGEALPDEAVYEFIRDIGEETSEGQLARWEGPICPYVTGLRDGHNRYVADTISAVAVAVGVQPADDECAVNLVVIVNSELNRLIEELRSEQPLLFEALNPAQRSRLAEGSAPVRVWSVLDMRGSDGRRMTATDAGPPFYRSVAILSGVLPSRILRSTRVDLATTFVLLDAARLEGLNLQQISGFVSMLALAQLDTREPVEPDRSILNLFHNAEAPPDDLTAWDIAYLRALYASDNRRSASAQRGQMARMMREDLAADEE